MTMKPCKQIVLATITALVLVPSLALAQTNAPQSETTLSAEMQSLIQDFRETARKLQQIKQKTVQSNPELKAQYKQFQAKMEAAMAAAGYDTENNRQRLKEIGQKLKSGNVSKSKRQELIQELRSMQQKMLKARKAVLQKPDIQAARRELHQKTLAAMREQSEKTDELLNHMKQLRNKLLAMQKSAQGAGK